LQTVSSKDTTTPPPAGGILWESEGLDLEQFKVDSGAGNADRDAYNFRLQVSAGVSIPELFLSGSTADANLASATALMKPVENSLSSYLDLWKDTHTGILRHIVGWNNVGADQNAPEINVEAPKITSPVLADMGDTINKIGQIDERILQPEVFQILFEAFGIKDIEELMARLPAEIVRPPVSPPSTGNGAGDPARARSAVGTGG